jgi:hypothetical protein
MLLKAALRVVEILTHAGLYYLVEPDRYTGGVIFRSERVGAFFYVAPDTRPAACKTLEQAGYTPIQESY